MKNERGNAIALVLMILAVVSLVGAGALMMSRYDVRFSHALRSYDMGFNLADGGATISYRDLAKRDREQSVSIRSDYQTNVSPAVTIYCQCIKPSECSSTPVTCPSGRCVDRSAGDYKAQVQFGDWDTKPEEGYEIPGYYSEYWNGLGVSERASQESKAKMAAGLTDTFKSGNSTVQANVQKKKQTGH